MKKQILSLFLIAILVMVTVLTGMTGVQASPLTATPTASNVLVNGKNLSFEAYNINGNNYFKLRDLALALSGSEKEFDVTWDGEKKSINLISNQSYTVVGGELAKGDGTPKYPTENLSSLLLNGKEISLRSYTIKGNNFFKLRDLALAFDIGVDWHATTNSIGIDTSTTYEVQPSTTLPVKDVLLRVVYVTKEWSPFTDISGWNQAVILKEANGVKYYEAAIWEDTHSIHLYALPNDYDGFYGQHENLSTEEKVAYRESFCLKKFEGMPVKWSERGAFVLNAFTEFANILVEKHPNASHNLIYSGHGSYHGELFEEHLNQTQATKLLSNWHNRLGRKLGFVDMGGPCNKGTYSNLEMVYKHADYYIASDLSVGCTTYDTFTMETYNRSDPDYNFIRLLSIYTDMEDALIERVNLGRLRYEDSINNIIAAKSMESLYLYSCSEFAKHKDSIQAFMTSKPFEAGFTIGLEELGIVDIKDVMISNNADPQLLQSFDSIIIHSVDTKDMFHWPYNWNGITWIMLDE